MKQEVNMSALKKEMKSKLVGNDMFLQALYDIIDNNTIEPAPLENTCEWKYRKYYWTTGCNTECEIKLDWRYCPRCGRRMKRKEGYHSCPYPDGSKQESEVAYCGDVITDCSECEHNDDCGCDHDIEGCDHIRNLKVEEK